MISVYNQTVIEALIEKMTMLVIPMIASISFKKIAQSSQFLVQTCPWWLTPNLFCDGGSTVKPSICYATTCLIT